MTDTEADDPGGARLGSAKPALSRMDSPEMVRSTAAIFWPDLIEHEGYAFLRDGFSIPLLERWKQTDFYAQAGMRGVVAGLNHRHVADMLRGVAQTMTEEELAALGRIIGSCWKARLEDAFPDRSFDFELTTEIWFWERHGEDGA